MTEPITAERLRELLAYDPETGVFTRRLARKGHRAGEVVGRSNEEGYWRISIDGREYKAHRLVWFWTEGEWPKGGLDHINNDPSDNRRCNLRMANQSENMANASVRSDNKSGLKAVHWHKGSRKWTTRIVVNERKRFLGYFDNPEDAHKVYHAAAAWAYGEFARIK